MREQRCCLSAIVVAEIRYGLEKRPAAVRLQALAEATLETLEILPWTDDCARVYGRLRAALEREGKPLAALDLLIASHALALTVLPLAVFLLTSFLGRPRWRLR